MPRKTIIAAAGAVALAAGAGGVATAATTTHTQRPAAQFQQELASKLGVSQTKLRSAIRDAARDTGYRGLGPRHAPRRAGLQAEASALGMTIRELRAALAKGTTPADLIAAKGKDPAAVKATVRTAVRTALDPAVEHGRLDAAKADARADAVATRLTADAALGRQHG